MKVNRCYVHRDFFSLKTVSLIHLFTNLSSKITTLLDFEAKCESIFFEAVVEGIHPILGPLNYLTIGLTANGYSKRKS